MENEFLDKRITSLIQDDFWKIKQNYSVIVYLNALLGSLVIESIIYDINKKDFLNMVSEAYDKYNSEHKANLENKIYTKTK